MKRCRRPGATGRPSAGRPSTILVAAALLAGAGAVAGPAPDQALARGDAAWEARAEGHVGARARPGPASRAASAYAEAVEAAPDALEPHWKRVRALWFEGEYAYDDDDAQREAFRRATEASRAALEALARELDVDTDALGDVVRGSPSQRLEAAEQRDAASVLFWSAIAWGAWSRMEGLLATVREGVANRLHAYSQGVLALEPGLEQGGAHRLLARLHARLPQVPFLSGWVDREQALPEARAAMEIAPDYAGNQLVLALTLLDRAPDRRPEAIALLEEVVRAEPRPDHVVEDLSVRAEAREKLDALRSGSE